MYLLVSAQNLVNQWFGVWKTPMTWLAGFFFLADGSFIRVPPARLNGRDQLTELFLTDNKIRSDLRKCLFQAESKGQGSTRCEDKIPEGMTCVFCVNARFLVKCGLCPIAEKLPDRVAVVTKLPWRQTGSTHIVRCRIDAALDKTVVFAFFQYISRSPSECSHQFAKIRFVRKSAGELHLCGIWQSEWTLHEPKQNMPRHTWTTVWISLTNFVGIDRKLSHWGKDRDTNVYNTFYGWKFWLFFGLRVWFSKNQRKKGWTRQRVFVGAHVGLWIIAAVNDLPWPFQCAKLLVFGKMYSPNGDVEPEARRRDVNQTLWSKAKMFGCDTWLNSI